MKIPPTSGNIISDTEVTSRPEADAIYFNIICEIVCNTVVIT